MELKIAVDFDGVIHRYSKGWHDGTIYDPPMDGCYDAMNQLKERFENSDLDNLACFIGSDAFCDTSSVTKTSSRRHPIGLLPSRDQL